MVSELKPSWALFFIAGALIIAGIPTGWTENFLYWLVPRAIYCVGVVFFWMDR